jgi:hypothetical protein
MQNQQTFFHPGEQSNPNKKYSIATTVVAAPTTPMNTRKFAAGMSNGTPRLSGVKHKATNSPTDRTTAVR